MGVGAFFRRLDRLAGRFNAWFGPAAVAANVEAQSSGRQAPVDPTRVKVILTEIEKPTTSDDRERRD
jgi:hypothetical protein